MATDQYPDHHHVRNGGRDTGPAFVGLFSAAIFLLVVVFSIVKWTNGRYAGEHGAAGAAAESTH